MALTKRQKEVLDFLVGFLNKHGDSPSFEEIARSLRLTSLATVHKHITTLEKKGFIRRGYNQSRSIEIMQLPKPVREQVSDRQMMELPLAGRIAAGRPLEAVEANDTLSLGDFARAGNSFVLQVKGNSMVDDHILDGDYIVVEQTQVANPGEIVVALVRESEATLKRFYREAGGKIRLQPANSEMHPIIVPASEVKIQGRVVSVLRKYYCPNGQNTLPCAMACAAIQEQKSNRDSSTAKCEATFAPIAKRRLRCLKGGCAGSEQLRAVPSVVLVTGWNEPVSNSVVHIPLEDYSRAPRSNVVLFSFFGELGVHLLGEGLCGEIRNLIHRNSSSHNRNRRLYLPKHAQI